MPTIVGTVNVNSLSGVLNIGDARTIAPQGFFRTYAGGGSFNSGEHLNVNTAPSVINVYGIDAFEQYSPSPSPAIISAGVSNDESIH
ncbi:spore germination protein [Paenibacillus sp. SI8]|uniref:spore germination protein n=1 Tax=unclassified Paenibacillus TaxID=185978 RepID=UPI0034672444